MYSNRRGGGSPADKGMMYNRSRGGEGGHGELGRR